MTKSAPAHNPPRDPSSPKKSADSSPTSSFNAMQKAVDIAEARAGNSSRGLCAQAVRIPFEIVTGRRFPSGATAAVKAQNMVLSQDFVHQVVPYDQLHMAERGDIIFIPNGRKAGHLEYATSYGAVSDFIQNGKRNIYKNAPYAIIFKYVGDGGKGSVNFPQTSYRLLESQKSEGGHSPIGRSVRSPGLMRGIQSLFDPNSTEQEDGELYEVDEDGNLMTIDEQIAREKEMKGQDQNLEKNSSKGSAGVNLPGNQKDPSAPTRAISSSLHKSRKSAKNPSLFEKTPSDVDV